jgi:hypothetical protein
VSAAADESTMKNFKRGWALYALDGEAIAGFSAEDLQGSVRPRSRGILRTA